MLALRNCPVNYHQIVFVLIRVNSRVFPWTHHQSHRVTNEHISSWNSEESSDTLHLPPDCIIKRLIMILLKALLMHILGKRKERSIISSLIFPCRPTARRLRDSRRWIAPGPSPTCLPSEFLFSQNKKYQITALSTSRREAKICFQIRNLTSLICHGTAASMPPRRRSATVLRRWWAYDEDQRRWVLKSWKKKKKLKSGENKRVRKTKQPQFHYPISSPERDQTAVMARCWMRWIFFSCCLETTSVKCPHWQHPQLG